MGKILGLDLGITSVGFGIIEEDTYDIVDYGVRLFDEGTADNNLTRRMMRSGRRLKSRRRNRINAIKHLLVNNGIIDSLNFETLNNVYELRVKGLNEKLSSLELANVLVNIAKRRGSSLEVVVDEEDSEDSDSTSASALTNNTSALKKNNQYICEYQLNILKNGNKLRNHDNIFKTEDYEKELRKILSNQELSDELNEKIVEIVTRRREFSEGPGSEKFPTPYGSYREEYVDGNKVIKHVNLIEEMRGKCSIFKDEPRIAKNTFTACLFNFLNDLNNINIDGKTKLTTDQKHEIIEKYIMPKGKLTIAQLLKYLNISEDKVSGMRIDKNGKKIITTFDGYYKVHNILPENLKTDTAVIDNIIEILTKTAVMEERKTEIEKLGLNLSAAEVDSLSKTTKMNGYHSLSKKAMDILIPELFETSKNQMQIIAENNLGKNNSKYSGPNIPFDEDAILSPVAKRVHMQALKVVNELRKTYGEFSSVVIETTRAKNSKDEIKDINDQQKRFEENKKKTEELLLQMDKNPDDYSTTTKLKLVLYKQQNGKTIYAGLPIDLNRLLNDETAYQIEHIIPYAVSFDNSMNNKALASAKENQDKGRKTPWGYFSSGMVPECNGSIKNWDEYKAIVESLPITSKKKANLLNQEDVCKYDNMQEFVARNLNDTSYGIRTVMNTMKKYYKDNNIDTKVFTIRGKITHDFRSLVGLKKDRDIYIHHAVDALIIAGSKNEKVFNNAYNLFTDDNGLTSVRDTGEVYTPDMDPFTDGRFRRYLKGLKEIEGKPEDFSYKVDKKTNRSFADQTIYSTRNVDGEDWIIKKYRDIYGSDGESLKKLFDNGVASTKLLMAQNDIETFNILQKIYESYKNEKNPFAKYKEENGPIKKYSKKGNGPDIVQIKYRDSKLGNHLDVSEKYGTKNNKKVVLLQNSPYRTDIYISPDGLYKMVTIRRYHIKQINGKNVIDRELYKQLLESKKITKDDKFLFSLNRNDIVDLVTKNDFVETNGEHKYYRMVATNNELANVIEFKLVDRNSSKRYKISVGKSVLKFDKYNVSPAGKWSKVIKEDLKLEW